MTLSKFLKISSANSNCCKRATKLSLLTAIIYLLLVVILYQAAINIAYADDFAIDFDSWPTPACYSGNGSPAGAPVAQCNGSSIEPAFDLSTGQGLVDSFPDCRSGKCVRFEYTRNEQQHQLRPRGPSGYFFPSNENSEVFFRVHVKLGPDHFTGFNAAGDPEGMPYQYKLTRWITNSGEDSTDIFINYNSVIFNGDIISGGSGGGKICVVGMNWYEHLDEWIKIEGHVKLNDPGQSNGTCKLWVTGEDGVQIASTDKSGLRYYNTPTYRRIAWIFANTSNKIGPCNNNGQEPFWPPCGGSSTRTVFLDDICIGNSLADRDGFCADTSTPPPSDMVAPDAPSNLSLE